MTYSNKPIIPTVEGDFIEMAENMETPDLAREEVEVLINERS